MGEIKSTLDIIMEKTKNLTMTEEEKRAFKEQETAGKVTGLVQRYADGVITGLRFEEGVADLDRESGDKDTVRRFLVEEAVGHIHLGWDNEPFLRILELVPGTGVAAAREILDGFVDRVVRRRDEHEERLRLRLSDLGISGSAVIPNLEADHEWKQGLEELDREMKQKLKKTIEA
ncbi:MAG: hypothetical protein JXL84_06300 [Deltaproteobacteria bacterium]|nr:hypothetical protein [Deltaproteobacteria bacterium]